MTLGFGKVPGKVREQIEFERKRNAPWSRAGQAVSDEGSVRIVEAPEARLRVQSGRSRREGIPWRAIDVDLRVPSLIDPGVVGRSAISGAPRAIAMTCFFSMPGA